MKLFKYFHRLVRIARLTMHYTTWDGRRWARWEADQNICLTLPEAFKVAKVLVDGELAMSLYLLGYGCGVSHFGKLEERGQSGHLG